ncbi:MAG: tetratricopeptide repeat protein [Polyangiaceae bacterium]
MREFALEKLRAADASRAVIARHDAYFLELARRLATREAASGDVEARDALARDLDNLLDVHLRATRTEPDSTVVELEAEVLLAVDCVLGARVPASERIELFRRTAERVCLTGASDAAAVLGGLGRAQHASGELAAARVTLDDAIGRARARGDTALESRLLVDLGVVHQAARELDAARAAYRAALELHSVTDRRLEARAVGNLGAASHDERDFDAARAAYERSVELAAGVGDVRIEGIMLTNLGVLDQEEGRHARAAMAFERAIDLLGRARDPRLLGITRANLGTLHAERGSLSLAREEIERAVLDLLRTGDDRSAGLALARLGAVRALDGDRAGAHANFEDATARFARRNDELGLAVVRVARAFAFLRDVPPAFDEVRAAVAETRQPRGAQRPWIEVCDDVRTLVRLLEAALARAESGGPVELEPAPEALVIDSERRSIRAPGTTEWRYLGDHEAAWRILSFLVGDTSARPEPASVEALAQVGWPGQRILPDAAKNRVYVMLAWLRKQGLDRVVLRRDGGYLVDPAITIQRVSVGAPMSPEPKSKRSRSKR